MDPRDQQTAVLFPRLSCNREVTGWPRKIASPTQSEARILMNGQVGDLGCLSLFGLSMEVTPSHERSPSHGLDSGGPVTTVMASRCIAHP